MFCFGIDVSFKFLITFCLFILCVLWGRSMYSGAQQGYYSIEPVSASYFKQFANPGPDITFFFFFFFLSLFLFQGYEFFCLHICK